MDYILKNKNLFTLFISTFLFFTNEAMLLPTLPVFLAENGYSNFQIGVVLGAFALGVLFSRPFAGWMTDAGTRKSSLVTGVLFFMVAPAFYTLSASWCYILVLRFFHGFGISFYSTAAPVFITDIVPEQRRGEILGHMATATTLAFTLGPMAATALFKALGFEALLMVCVLVGIGNLAAVLRLVEPERKRAAEKQGFQKAAVLTRSVLVPSFSQLINAMIFGGIMTFLPLLLNQISGVSIGLFFMIESVTIIVCRFGAAHLSDRYGRGPVYVYSFMVILTAVYLISMIQGPFLLVTVAVLFGTGSALASPAIAAYVADRSAPSARGAVFAFLYGAYDLGVIASGFVLGYLADLTGLRAMFVLLALAGAASLMIFSLNIQKGVANSLKWTFLPAGRTKGNS